MCQQYAGEKAFLVKSEIAEIRATYAKHVSGEAPLTDGQLKELAVKKIMLEEML